VSCGSQPQCTGNPCRRASEGELLYFSRCSLSALAFMVESDAAKSLRVANDNRNPHRARGLRHNLDIDHLVHPKSIAAATTLLERAGYHRTEPPTAFSAAQLEMWLISCKELAYFHGERRFKVELHARPFNNPRLMAEMPAASSLRIVPLVQGMGVYTFGEDDLFAYMCAHGAIHCWFRLKWLADIGALLARQSKESIERLYRAAEARGAGQGDFDPNQDQPPLTQEKMKNNPMHSRVRPPASFLATRSDELTSDPVP
jgi:Uncharacterised nucleotidyltransferase